MRSSSPFPQPSPGRIEPRGFFSGVQIRPIIAGAVVDYLATYVLTMFYLVFFYMREAFEKGGVTEKEIQEALERLLSSEDGVLTLVIIGTLGTVIGGYIAGRTASAEETKHGALVGAVSLALGLLQSAAAGEARPVPEWLELLGYALAIPAGAAGGALAQGQSKIWFGKTASGSGPRA